MSKITFRADDELIRQLEEFDASKSEVMRKALREYLGEAASGSAAATGSAETLDAAVADRVDELIADRFERSFTPSRPQDINVNITLDGDSTVRSDVSDEDVTASDDTSHAVSNDSSHSADARKTESGGNENTGANESKTCTQCGENLSLSHVYCPNCGEKSARRVFCDCGDELRSDWAFCPSCGRRTPAADVLDKG
jgi:predicted RNA-binding Zn-ribbon protein involved in translation (DUF1610 family)